MMKQQTGAILNKAEYFKANIPYPDVTALSGRKKYTIKQKVCRMIESANTTRTKHATCMVTYK